MSNLWLFFKMSAQQSPKMVPRWILWKPNPKERLSSLLVPCNLSSVNMEIFWNMANYMLFSHNFRTYKIPEQEIWILYCLMGLQYGFLGTYRRYFFRGRKNGKMLKMVILPRIFEKQLLGNSSPYLNEILYANYL